MNKYTVFFVDDEIIVREGIRNCLAWENTQFSLVGEAQDGEIALSMIQDIKPDILITDIKMPFLNGLELSKMVKKMQPWIKIIILSGHDEFEYAKQAISIGVVDYLLKPFTAEELLKCLKKTSDEIEHERKKSDEMILLKHQLDLNSDVLKDRFLCDLVKKQVSIENCISKATELNLDLIARWYTILLIKIVNTEKSISNVSLKSVLTNILEKNNESERNFIIFSFNKDSSSETLGIIVKNYNAEVVEDDFFSIADAIKHEILRNKDAFVCIGIGSTVERIANISTSFEEAENALNVAIQSGTNKIIYFSDVKNEVSGNLLKLGGDPIVDQLKYALQEEIDQITSDYLKLIGENNYQFSIIGSYLMIEVIVASCKIIEELGGLVDDVFPEMKSQSFVSNAVSSVESFTKETKRLLQKVLEYRDSRMNSKYADMILKAKKYIDKHYNDQDICLHSVAEEVNVSPNHFSAVFSQECGFSFIEYLTGVRIEVAKKLLKTSDLKALDIAYEVGFNDPHYFSFIFKKITGLTPIEYRNK